MSTVPSYANFDEYRHSVISIPMSRRQSLWQPGGSEALHRGSIVASHLSIPRTLRKQSILEDGGVFQEEGGKPIWDAIREEAAILHSDKNAAIYFIVV
jgi:hypothetical protein